VAASRATPRSAPTGVALILRSLPLRPRASTVGALILVRDVTDLRRRDRELVTKDATIREIHHRVKNNLQTVAALLRLQAGGWTTEDARLALEEAVRRVGSIAIVHETLSQAVEEHVEFDEIADRLGRMVTDVGGSAMPGAGTPRGQLRRARLRVATPLAMVLTEVLQNAVEHGYRHADVSGGAGRILSRRDGSSDGCTSPSRTTAGACPRASTWTQSTSLGLSIVRTLVESELGGQLELGAGACNAHRHPRRDRRAGVSPSGAESPGRARRCGPGRGRCGA
jgi:two-component sensor histidine kinase